MKNKVTALLLVSSSLLVACNDQMTSSPVVDKADAIASVNGTYISKAQFDAMKKEVTQNGRGQSIPDDQLIERLVQTELLVQAANKNKLADKPEFVLRMELMKNALLSQAAVQDYIEANPPTDEELKAQYDKQFGGAAGEEYKARHILLKTEEEAKKMIAQLDKGADFATLAKEHSTGPSAPNGGDLGWFEPNRMVPPFSEAVIALENGKYTPEPVKTQFGWHVILREDSRTKTPPAFEEVKEHFVPLLRNQKVTEYLDNLRNQADVEVFLAEAEAIEVPEETPAKTEEKATEEHADDNAKTADQQQAEPAATAGETTEEQAQQKETEPKTEK